MSEQEKQKTEKKEYFSKVLVEWETPDKIKEGKILFPKKSCMCRICHFSDWQLQEVENTPEEDEQEQDKEHVITTRLELTNYCHDRYTITHQRGLPNVIACDGFYKQPKE